MGAGLGVATGDYNEDGWPDLYVANDATPNQLWINQRNGTFADEGLLSGAALNASGNPEGSMGIASGDFNLDGNTDLAVANFHSNDVSVLLGNGDGTFQSQVTYAVGNNPVAIVTGDFTGDGRTDLAIANNGSGDVSVLLARKMCDWLVMTAVFLSMHVRPWMLSCVFSQSC